MASIFDRTSEAHGRLRLAIGMDFGATSTGVYVKFSGSAASRADLAVGNWPEGAGTDYQSANSDQLKIPTRLATDGWVKHPGVPSQPVRWGLMTSDDEASFQWFKLGLVHLDDITEDDLGELHGDMRDSAELDKAVVLRAEHHTSAKGVTIVYLRSVWNHVIEEIASYLMLPEDVIRRSEIHVAIGTPANSKYDTVSRLRGAAESAGIPGYYNSDSKLYVCVEPEAAAVALVEHRLVSQNLTSGDIITVCDCGGGTADAASYEITSTEPFELEECVSGTARFCGPVLLDGIFRSRIEHKLRQAANTPDSVTAADIRRLYSNLWESHIKRRFDGSDTTSSWTEQIPAHLTAQQGKRPGLRSAVKVVGFTRDELLERLDPTVNKIVGLVRHQVEAVAKERTKLPKCVIVCGGFSGNRYLRTKLKEEIERLNKKFKPESPTNLEFSPEVHSRGVVSMGCATHAYKNGCEHHDLGQPIQRSVSVASRVARLSYGLDPGAPSPVRQLVTKGQSLPVAQPPRRTLQVDDFIKKNDGTVGLYIFEAAEAIIQRKTMVEVCRLVWNNHGVTLLEEVFQRTPPCLVELAADCAGNNVNFKVYINGGSLSPGEETGLQVTYKMKDSTL